MIDLALDSVFVLLAIAAIYSRNLAAIVFTITVILHDVLFSDFVGLPYYFSAALIDLLTITAIYYMPSRITCKLMLVSVLSIVLNIYGWVIYEAGVAPISYSASFLALYVYAMYIMTTGAGDARHHKLRARDCAVRRYPMASRGHH